MSMSSTLARYTALAVGRTPPKLLSALERLPLTSAKYLVALLFLLNYGGWPLAWHARIMSPLFEGFLAIHLIKLLHIFSPKQSRKAALEAWYESQMPIGEHPFRKVWTRGGSVRLDQSDFNMHMSNSSYAMILDSARLRLALSAFPNIFRSGGWVPLSATHFHFIREIPIFSRYEVRVTIGSFDDKWLWVVSRFVKPVSVSKNRRTPLPPQNPLATTDSGASSSANASSSNPEAIAQSLLAREAAKTEPDGALLYSITVEQFCFKQGRMTVPPGIVLAANGFHSGAGASVPSASHKIKGKPAPPPHWPAVRRLMRSSGLKDLARFYAGGWKDVPEGERWWEEAMKHCEEERRVRLSPFVGGDGDGGEVLGGLKGGMEGVRGLGEVGAIRA
ncbi:hypothetical protein FB45DRAFT_1001409 [Roridomyces roridus]|uniref:Uncharacterized protein n=1 Tax=Roridomyces roridus TaxID=1738132 RepID=A0AAD7C0U1_9AGAR|nr:hypothetical protein FB45DRAFT_1001409 [Roridomyces roridus]